MIPASALLVVVLMATAVPSRQPDDVVARVATRAITYRMIRCHPELDQNTARLMGDNRPVAEICREAERQMLASRLRREMIREAATICDIQPGDAMLRTMAPWLFDEKAMQDRITVRVAKATAASRILRGDPIGPVYEAILHPLGISRASFEAELPYWTADAAEAFLADRPADTVREELRRDATIRAVEQILAARHAGDDAARRAFWEEVFRVSKTSVADGYEMPQWRSLP